MTMQTDQSPSREAKAREDAALAAFKAIYGLNADPFQNPEGYDFCAKVADAVCTAFADATRPQVSDEALSDSDLKDAVTELLGHRGERPYRVLRGGQVLWETWLPAFRAAVRYLPAALHTQPSQAIPDAQAGLREAREFAVTVQQELADRSPAYSIASIEREHFDRAILAINGLLRAALAAPHPIARADDGEGEA